MTKSRDNTDRHAPPRHPPAADRNGVRPGASPDPGTDAWQCCTPESVPGGWQHDQACLFRSRRD